MNNNNEKDVEVKKGDADYLHVLSKSYFFVESSTDVSLLKQLILWFKKKCKK